MVKLSLQFTEKDEKGKLMFVLEVSISLSRLTSQISDIKYSRILNEKKITKKLKFIWKPYVAVECIVYLNLP